MSIPRLQGLYHESLKQALKAELGYASSMAVPRLIKIVLNMGVGEAVTDKKHLEAAQADLAAISGQKPVVSLSRKSNAGFKIRAGWPIGCKVTLRRQRMYEFLDRLISIAIPRIRDFRGFSAQAFDGRGNYTLGISEQIIFPEIQHEKVDLRGLDVTLVTTARTNLAGFALLKAFGFPFKRTADAKNG